MLGVVPLHASLVVPCVPCIISFCFLSRIHAKIEACEISIGMCISAIIYNFMYTSETCFLIAIHSVRHVNRNLRNHHYGSESLGGGQEWTLWMLKFSSVDDLQLQTNFCHQYFHHRSWVLLTSACPAPATAAAPFAASYYYWW